VDQGGQILQAVMLQNHPHPRVARGSDYYLLSIMKYSVIAKSFLKYYWHQICNYKIKQNFNSEKLPLIVQIIQGIFGKKHIPDRLESMDRNEIEKAEREISRQCFHEVIPRFQNSHTSNQQVFYEYDKNQISLKPQAMKYFKQNHPLLLNSVILEWAKFLEKINTGLPTLISKVEGHTPKRASLERTRKVLSNHLTIVFIAVDHCRKTNEIFM
jgi:hypothetical protein